MRLWHKAVNWLKCIAIASTRVLHAPTCEAFDDRFLFTVLTLGLIGRRLKVGNRLRNAASNILMIALVRLVDC